MDRTLAEQKWNEIYSKFPYHPGSNYQRGINSMVEMKKKWLIGAWKWFVWKVMSPAQILIGRNVRFSACKWVYKGNNPSKNSPGTYSFLAGCWNGLDSWFWMMITREADTRIPCELHRKSSFCTRVVTGTEAKRRWHYFGNAQIRDIQSCSVRCSLLA